MPLEQHDELAILRLDNGKANAIDDALLDELDAALVALAASDARALVITGYDRFFCAGLDLKSVVHWDRPSMARFMTRFGEVLGRLFRCDRPVVAAVNGHAVAGGCVLACQADWRVLVDRGAKFGTNEVRLGVGVPPIAIEPLRLFASAASASRAVLTGELFDPPTALQLGLVHELAPAGELLDRARQRARELAAVPAPAFAQAKAAWQRPARAALDAAGPVELEGWLDTWFSAEAQRLVRSAVEGLARS